MDGFSENALRWMRQMGNFGPTADGLLLHGWLYDGCGGADSTYWDAADLRELAAACMEVAEFLEKNVDQANMAPDA